MVEKNYVFYVMFNVILILIILEDSAVLNNISIMKNWKIKNNYRAHVQRPSVKRIDLCGLTATSCAETLFIIVKL